MISIVCSLNNTNCLHVRTGVFKGPENFDVYIDVKAIPELYQVEVSLGPPINHIPWPHPLR